MDIDDELQPADFAAAWDDGVPVEVHPSRPRLVVEGQGAGPAPAQPGIRLTDVDESTLSQLSFMSVGVKVQATEPAVLENVGRD